MFGAFHAIPRAPTQLALASVARIASATRAWDRTGPSSNVVTPTMKPYSVSRRGEEGWTGDSDCQNRAGRNPAAAVLQNDHRLWPGWCSKRYRWRLRVG